MKKKYAPKPTIIETGHPFRMMDEKGEFLAIIIREDSDSVTMRIITGPRTGEEFTHDQ